MRIHYKMKYGQKGLILDLYHKNTKLDRIIVSKNHTKIFEFLGLSYERWKMGFDELEDIFEFVASSKFFNWRSFQLSELNRINRERNLKRKSYLAFLEWIPQYASINKHEELINLEPYDFHYINNFFPEANLVLEFRRVEYEHCRELYIKSKFNGGDIMERYGIEGKLLGHALSGFKKYVEDNYNTSYDDFILRLDKDEIYTNFDEYLTLQAI
jgi:hypothetical protein